MFILLIYSWSIVFDFVQKTRVWLNETANANRLFSFRLHLNASVKCYVCAVRASHDLSMHDHRPRRRDKMPGCCWELINGIDCIVFKLTYVSCCYDLTRSLTWTKRSHMHDNEMRCEAAHVQLHSLFEWEGRKKHLRSTVTKADINRFILSVSFSRVITPVVCARTLHDAQAKWLRHVVEHAEWVEKEIGLYPAKKFNCNAKHGKKFRWPNLATCLCVCSSSRLDAR